ncbi:MAG: LPS export ABC transporter permease LptG [Alphaproteobacteria bacterium]|nr:LPS export ABC transporter permease LptG [Alphaproteobacteria bacterium]
MKIGTTLSGYLARIYTINMLWLLAALLGVIYLFDTVELLRRAGKAEDVPLVLVLQMGLLKLPEVGQILFPFAILFSAMYTFWQLTRCYELIVVRAAGFSVWQFMAPVLGVAVLTGLLQMSLINPVGAVLVGKFEQLENTYLNRQTSQIAVFKEGLWLRQAIPAGSSTQNPEGYVILHAEKVKQPGWALKNVSVLFFDESDTFLQRLDADSASLQNGYWDFDHAVIHKKDGKTRQDSGAVLPTQLTIQDVEDSFASPDTMSFWHLPSYIRTLEETGFDASRLRVHYYNLMAQPLLFAAMVLLAAIVSLRPPRNHGALGLFTGGVFAGFLIFFMSSFLQALGASQQIPPFWAAWSPALICFLLGLAAVMSLEDG